MATQYVFIPWLRRGLATQIQDADPLTGDNGNGSQADVKLGIKVMADGAQRSVVNQEVKLTGPGDIVGFNRSAVVKTEPATGIRNFEPNYFPYIEFYEEDFLWRYTPAGAAAGRRLRPWIFLIVLRETEFESITKRPSSGIREIIVPEDVRNIALPPAEQTWAWAHTQINDSLLNKNDLNDPALRNRKVADSLQANPNLGVSRLISPRKLDPDTRYFAFVIPSFESGRIAGLGGTIADIKAAGKLKSSWGDEQGFRPDHYPVYYEWNFHTGTDDFEILARKITPKDLSGSDVGRLWMDASSINYGSKFDYNGNLDPGGDPALKGFLQFEGALRLPAPPTPNLLERSGNEEKKFVSNFSTLINLGIRYRNETMPELGWSIGELGNDEDDPLLVPPVYGRWYTAQEGSTLLDPGKQGNWLEQLNLDPALRVAAGLGAGVVKENQEEFMSRAWEQLNENRHKLNKKLQQLRFAQEVTRATFRKHFAGKNQDSEEVTNRMLALTQSVHASIRTGESDLSVAGMLAGNLSDAAFVKPVYRRLTRTNGPVMKAVRKDTAAKSIVMSRSVNLFTFSTILIADPPYQNFDSKKLQKVDSAKFVFMPGPWPNIALALQRPGWVSDSQGFFLVHRSEFPAMVKNLQDKILPRPFILTAASLNYKVMSANVLEKIQPANSFKSRYMSMIPSGSPPPVETNEIISPNSFNPFFNDPVYERLAGMVPELFIPNLDKIGPDSFVLLQANPAFIEGFLAGMNHEMASEFLWRGFPSDANATFFRQFWDNADSDVADPARPDILPIRTWPSGNALGKNAPPGKVENPLVFVIKAELVKKYPNLVIYAQKAARNANGSRSLNKNVPPKNPVFLAGLDPDFLFAGFDLSREEVLGQNSDDGRIDGTGWYFVIAERPGEMHFGLDRERKPGKTMESWDDLAWTDLPSGINSIDLNRHIPETPPEDPDLSWGKGESPVTGDPASGSGDAAQMAAILQQKPVQIFIHASLLVT